MLNSAEYETFSADKYENAKNSWHFHIYLQRKFHAQLCVARNHKTLQTEKVQYMSLGPEVIKVFSCSTQLSMKFSLLIDMKMPTIVGIFIFISRENFMLSYVKQERICNC